VRGGPRAAAFRTTTTTNPSRCQPLNLGSRRQPALATVIIRRARRLRTFLRAFRQFLPPPSHRRERRAEVNGLASQLRRGWLAPLRPRYRTATIRTFLRSPRSSVPRKVSLGKDHARRLPLLDWMLRLMLSSSEKQRALASHSLAGSRHSRRTGLHPLKDQSSSLKIEIKIACGFRSPQRTIRLAMSLRAATRRFPLSPRMRLVCR